VAAFDIAHYQAVDLPTGYATQVLDRNHAGLISIQQITKDPVLTHILVPSSLRTNNTKVITSFLLDKSGSNTTKATTAVSTAGANTSSLNTGTTSPSSPSSKR
jgi:hypothetical protein